MEPFVRLVIAGSRTIDPSIEIIDEWVSRFSLDVTGARELPPTYILEVICGCAPGSDRAGERWAKARGVPIHYEPITEADIAKKGKYLGPKQRNRRMADRGTHALIFWDGESSGSCDMVTRMLVRGKPVVVIPMVRTKRSRATSGLSDRQASLASDTK